MSLPGVGVTFKDFTLGIAVAAARSQAKIGTSSAGSAGTVYAFGDPDTAKTQLASGPLLEATADTLNTAGGPVLAVPVAASNVGTIGSYTHVGTGTGNVASTGTPLDAYQIVILIMSDGAVGTSTFRVSFDGGKNYSATYATAATVATFAATTGLTFTFAAGGKVTGDTYKATCVAPTYSSGDLATAWGNLMSSGASFEGVHVVGTVGGADDAAKVTAFLALAAAVSTLLTAAEAAGRYKYAILELPIVADAALQIAGVTGFVDTRQFWVAGDAAQTSSITAHDDRRSAGVKFASRVAKIEQHVLPGKVEDGPIPGIDLSQSFRDEQATPALDDLRINTLRTFDAQTPGVYITMGSTMAAPGSDYSLIPNRRVMDAIATAALGKLRKLVNKDFDVDPKTGFIATADANRIDAGITAELVAQFATGNPDGAGKIATAIALHISRTDNILSTKIITARIDVTPKGYARSISLVIGFKNPALPSG